MVIPNKIIYHQSNNPTQIKLMLDKVFTIYGGVSLTPEGGMKDFIGELTLREAIQYQFSNNLLWVQVIEFRFQTPFFIALYSDSEWHFYPEGLPHDV